MRKETLPNRIFNGEIRGVSDLNGKGTAKKKHDQQVLPRRDGERQTGRGKKDGQTERKGGSQSQREKTNHNKKKRSYHTVRTRVGMRGGSRRNTRLENLTKKRKNIGKRQGQVGHDPPRSTEKRRKGYLIEKGSL